jgi:hypothetical protein
MLRRAGFSDSETEKILKAGEAGMSRPSDMASLLSEANRRTRLERSMASIPLSPAPEGMLFNPRVSVNELKKRLDAKGEVAEFVGSGGEGDVVVKIRSKNGVDSVQAVKKFEWRPDDHVKALKDLAKFERDGRLGPFSVVKVQRVSGTSLVTDFVEGRPLSDLMGNSEFAKSSLGQQLRQRYLEGLRTVQNEMRKEGYFAEIRGGSGEEWNRLPHLWVTEGDPEGPSIFGIADDLIVDARTGQFVITDLF